VINKITGNKNNTTQKLKKLRNLTMNLKIANYFNKMFIFVVNHSYFVKVYMHEKFDVKFMQSDKLLLH